MPVANSGAVVQEGPGNQARLQPQADFLRVTSAWSHPSPHQWRWVFVIPLKNWKNHFHLLKKPTGVVESSVSISTGSLRDCIH